MGEVFTEIYALSSSKVLSKIMIVIIKCFNFDNIPVASNKYIN